MRFNGYWVSADASNPEVSIGEFDETDLSDHSNWKEAWQNDDAANAHGFIDPLAMLQSVSARIIGTLADDELQKAWTELRGGNPLRVNDAASFAKLVQVLIPKSLPQQPHHAKVSLPAESGDEIPLPD